MTRHKHTVIRLAISLGLMAAVLSLVDFGELVEVASRISWTYLLPIVILILMDRVIVVYKWRLLLIVRDVHLPFLRLFWMYQAAFLAGFLLPSTVGSDAVRAYSLKELNVNAAVAIASIMVERIIGFGCMLLLAAVGVTTAVYLMGEKADNLLGFGWVIALSLCLLFVLAIMIKSESFNVRLHGIMARWEGLWLVMKMRQVYEAFRAYRHHVDVLVKVSGYTFLRQMFPIFVNVLFVYAFSIPVTILELVAIVPLVVLGLRLPISIDGLGVQEGLYVLLFGLVGISAAQALLVSMSVRVIALVCILPLGLPYVFLRSRARGEADIVS